MSASRFDQALALVLRLEGGLSDHPVDRGGRTNHGITSATYRRYLALNKAKSRPVDQITSEEVRQIYRLFYWDVANCGALPSPVDLCVMQFGVVAGPGTAVRYLQRLLGVAVDGRCGPATVAAAKARNGPQLAAALLEYQQGHCADIIRRRPEQAVFAKGWRNRCTRTSQAVGLVVRVGA